MFWEVNLEHFLVRFFFGSSNKWELAFLGEQEQSETSWKCTNTEHYFAVFWRFQWPNHLKLGPFDSYDCPAYVPDPKQIISNRSCFLIRWGWGEVGLRWASFEATFFARPHSWNLWDAAATATAQRYWRTLRSPEARFSKTSYMPYSSYCSYFFRINKENRVGSAVWSFSRRCGSLPFLIDDPMSL